MAKLKPRRKNTGRLPERFGPSDRLSRVSVVLLTKLILLARSSQELSGNKQVLAGIASRLPIATFS